MSAADLDSEDTVWSIRGVPSALIQDVKVTARKKNMNIGQLVSLSLKKFFEEETSPVENDPSLNDKVAQIEARLAELEEAGSPAPKP